MTLATSRWLTPLVLELRQLLLGEVVPALAVAIIGSSAAAQEEDVRPLTVAQLQGTDWLSVAEAAQRLHVKEQTLRELAAKGPSWARVTPSGSTRVCWPDLDRECRNAVAQSHRGEAGPEGTVGPDLLAAPVVGAGPGARRDGEPRARAGGGLRDEARGGDAPPSGRGRSQRRVQGVAGKLLQLKDRTARKQGA